MNNQKNETEENGFFYVQFESLMNHINNLIAVNSSRCYHFLLIWAFSLTGISLLYIIEHEFNPDLIFMGISLSLLLLGSYILFRLFHGSILTVQYFRIVNKIRKHLTTKNSNISGFFTENNLEKYLPLSEKKPDFIHRVIDPGFFLIIYLNSVAVVICSYLAIRMIKDSPPKMWWFGILFIIAFVIIALQEVIIKIAEKKILKK
jgi:hypothetical protein